MKIKLAILEKDPSYLNRIVTAFSVKYADNLEIYSFTNGELALSALDTNRIDVFLVSDAFEIEMNAIPKRCGFAYFVDSPDVETLNNQRAICKFQKADLIYKEILSLYSENKGGATGLKFNDDSTKLIAFSSPSGGSGSSTAAAACAMHFATKGKKTLYLNLEKFGSADAFFRGSGGFDMSDVIYALKSKKTNLPMKLEGCVKQADNGVYFYSQTKVALDMLELSAEDMIRLLAELKITGSYDYIVADMDFSIDAASIQAYKQAHAVVWVGDGSELSNMKIQRAFTAVSILEQNAGAPLTDRLGLIYNKFSNKTGKTAGNIGIREIGGAPRYDHAPVEQILNQLSAAEMFDKII
ncbi:MAG: chromosome partitioning protein ParA [Ruminococcaceae bacterium]|nr:chromosome partitioning protein ParA [Oscillospiraceae bacterium]